MSLEELLQQMDDFHSRKQKRDCRPEWLKQFIKAAADLFEPLANSGRVGFDCQGHERGWTVCMYLGTTEIIGGPKDGQIEHASFMVDLNKLSSIFESVDRLEWYSVSNQNDDRFEDATRSVMSIHGSVQKGHDVHLELLHSPPRNINPGMKKTGDEVKLH